MTPEQSDPNSEEDWLEGLPGTATDDNGRRRTTTDDYGRQRTTTDPAGPDHGRRRTTTDDNGRQRTTTDPAGPDHGRQREPTTDDNGRQRTTTDDNGRQRTTTDDNGPSRAGPRVLAEAVSRNPIAFAVGGTISSLAPGPTFASSTCLSCFYPRQALKRSSWAVQDSDVFDCSANIVGHQKKLSAASLPAPPSHRLPASPVSTLDKRSSWAVQDSDSSDCHRMRGGLCSPAIGHVRL